MSREPPWWEQTRPSPRTWWLTEAWGKGLSFPSPSLFGAMEQLTDVPTQSQRGSLPTGTRFSAHCSRAVTALQMGQHPPPRPRHTCIRFISCWLSTSYAPRCSAAMAVAQVRAPVLEPGGQHESPDLATRLLCDFGEVT